MGGYFDGSAAGWEIGLGIRSVLLVVRTEIWVAGIKFGIVDDEGFDFVKPLNP